MINWGMAYPQQNALAGMEQRLAFGYNLARQHNENLRAEEGRNALAAYAANPTREGAAGLVAYNPQFGMSEIGRFDQQARAEAVNQARIGMVNGDAQAGQNLQQLDFDTWMQLDDRQRDQIGAQAEVIGQAALQIAQLPPEQRPMAWDQAIGQLSQRFPQLSQYQGQYSEAALNSAIQQAGLVTELFNQTRPSYQVIPQGGTLVNTRDPAAVSSVANGAPPPPANTTGQPQSIPASGFARVLRSMGNDSRRALEYLTSNNIAVQVSSPEEAQALPPGTPFIAPGETQVRTRN